MGPFPILAVLLAALLAGSCASAPPAAEERLPAGKGRVTSRLVAGGETVLDARITARRDLGVEFREKALQFPAEGPEGYAELWLDPGTWYLTAESADGKVFGYYGPNPVQVREGGELTVAIRGLDLELPPHVRSAGTGMSGVDGHVATEKGPLPGAVVSFYLDSSGTFRGPAYLEVETDGEGRFGAAITPGRYYVVVRKRSAGGELFGPLKPGDWFGFYRYNPLYVGSGEQVTIGASAVDVLRRSGWTRPSALRTRLSGIVRDGQGRPLEGYRVFLHRQPAMLGRPEFISESATGPDGTWQLWAEREGTFFMGARRAVGQAREVGEELGLYSGTDDGSLRVIMDGREMTGLDVVVLPSEWDSP